MRRFALWLLLAPLVVACSKDEIGTVQGVISADPASLSFGELFVGSSDFETVTLSNAGRSPAQLTVASIPDGYEVRPAEFTVPGASTVEVKVYFAPSKVGQAKGEIALRVVGGKNDSVSIAVDGEGVENVLEYETVSFGLVEVGKTVTKTLPLRSLVDFHISAQLSVVGGSGADVYSVERESLELDAGASDELTITFKPNRRGILNSFLEVRHCQGCAVTRIGLEGSGGVDALDAQPVDFHTRTPGSESQLPLALHNVGDFPISIDHLDLGDSDPAFSILDARALEIAPGETASYVVVFRADDAQGAREGTIRFVDPAGGVRPEIVPLRGIVGGIQIVSSPEGIDFGRQPIGVKAHKTFQLLNIGEKKVVYVVDPYVDGGPGFSLSPVEAPIAAGKPGAGGWKIDADATPITFEVDFTADEEGEWYGSLTFLILNADGTPSVEQPEVKVLLAARSIQPQPCSLQINPEMVRYGAVRAGRIYKKDIVVTNVGTDECFIWDVGFDEPTGRGYFSLETSFDETTYVVPPGETLSARVMYAPKRTQNSVDQAFFSFTQPGNQHQVSVSGQAVGFNLLVDPNPIALGTARLNERIFKDFSISNMGSSPVAIDSLAVASGKNAPYFGLEVDGGPPVIPGNGVTQPGSLSTWFKPSEPGTKASQVEIRVNGVIEPVLVDIRANGSEEECDDSCAPVAICPAPDSVTVNTKIRLQGNGTVPGDRTPQCKWTVVQAPRGSRAQPGPGCKPDFTPDIVGVYELELKVSDPYDTDNWDTCQTQVTATVGGGLWVETYWDHAGDIDLHLLNADLADPWQQPSWWSNADCFYGGKNRPWDPGIPGADANLDVDDIPGTGPENIRINNMAPHLYAVGLHNFNNSRLPVEVTTNVYCGGSQVQSITTVFEARKDFFILGLIDDQCAWTPDRTKWSNFH